MNKWKVLAIVFTLLSIGMLKETFRIFTSNAPDIAPNRTELAIMGIVLSSVIIFFTIRFWKKASEQKNFF
jgi:hypothetical protein